MSPQVSASLMVLFLAPAAAADNAARFDPGVFDLTYGAFCQQVSVDEVPAPDTAAQKVDLLRGTPEIRWPGPRIPMQPGVSFGVRTETTGLTVFSPVLIEVTHPPFAGSGITRQSYVTALGGGEASINAYSFDSPEEMVTGSWTFRAFHNGETLYEVTFDVVPATALPEIAGGCEGYLGS